MCRDEGHLLTKAGGYLVNIDESAGGGTHWTALWLAYAPKTVYYYDSYGLSAPSELVAATPGYQWLFADVARQTRDELNCGPRALIAIQLLGQAKNGAERRALFDRVIGEA